MRRRATTYLGRIGTTPTAGCCIRSHVVSTLYRWNLSAVEIQRGAVQPRCPRGDDKGDEIRHVFNLAVADDSSLAAELGADFGLGLARPLDLGADPPPLSLRLDQRRMDAVDSHAVLLAEIRQTLGEGRDGGIDRAADGEAPLRFSSAGSGDRHQRAAALLEQRPSRAREPHVGEKFQCVAFLPIGIGQLEKIAALGRAGIVDEDVEPAEFVPRRLDQRRGRGRLAQIERAYGGFALLAADRVCNVLECWHIAPREQDIAALGGQGQGDAAADAATRTGYERDLSLQSKLHSQLLVLASRELMELAEVRVKGGRGRDGACSPTTLAGHERP